MVPCFSRTVINLSAYAHKDMTQANILSGYNLWRHASMALNRGGESTATFQLSPATAIARGVSLTRPNMGLSICTVS